MKVKMNKKINAVLFAKRGLKIIFKNGETPVPSAVIAVEIAKAADKKPLSMAFSEIARGDVSYDPETIDAENH